MRRFGTRLIRRATLISLLGVFGLLGTSEAAWGGAAPVLAAVGDIACAPGTATDASTCHQQQTSQLVLGAAPTAVAVLGDNQYDNGTAAEYMGSFDPTWGRFKSLIWPVPGNHEYGTSGAAGYFGYFGLRAGDPSLGYYSYDLGSWHLIALNSSCADPGTPGPPSCVNDSQGHVTAAEVTWLNEDLASHSGVCTLAYWHHPRFSSGVMGDNPGTGALWDALYAHGADVVLNGHNHNYERFAPQGPAGNAEPQRGIRQFVVGSGGKSHFPFPGPPRPNTEIRNDTAFGVLFLALGSGSYGWTFQAEDGTTLDSGANACHAKTPPGGAAPPAGGTAPPSRISKLRITPTAFASAPNGPSAQPASRRRRHPGARVSYTLNQAATVRFTVQQKALGRRQGKGRRSRCRQPTKRNRHFPRCTRLVAIRGSFTLAAKAGANRFRFTGRLSRRKLKPGTYLLVATPDTGARTGQPTAAFRITP
jgi:hypothetical protein